MTRKEEEKKPINTRRRRNCRTIRTWIQSSYVSVDRNNDERGSRINAFRGDPDKRASTRVCYKY